MIKCFITDDEDYAVDTLKTYIEQTPGLELIGCASNGFDTLEFIKNNKVDLLFLDVHMPKMSGIEVLKLINIPVILTTAYSEYAIDGFDHDAVDYLLKPIGYSRFLKAVNKVLLPKEKTGNIASDTDRDYLFIKGEHKGKQIKIEFKDIVFVESSRNNVIFNCDKAKFTTKMPLKEVEDQLPGKLFFRVHNSYIISLKKIVAIDGNQVILKQLTNEGIKIPISPSFKDQFIRKITS